MPIFDLFTKVFETQPGCGGKHKLVQVELKKVRYPVWEYGKKVFKTKHFSVTKCLRCGKEEYFEILTNGHPL